MAYNTQKKEEFLDSLKNIKIEPLPEENLIRSFTPIGLSDLYELFQKLEEVPLSSAMYSKLSNMISLNYPQNISELLHNPITDNEINQLLEIIKQEYLQIVYNNNPKNINEKEQNRLKRITNRHYPSLFLDFIENPISVEEFSEQQKLIKDAFSNITDAYYNQSTPYGQKNLEYLGSAIYLGFKDLHPDMTVNIPERTKGPKSVNDNLNKESNRTFTIIVPSEIKDGIRLTDMEGPILSNKNNLIDKTTTDISAMTIVLNHINESMYFDENDPENEEILKLKKQRSENLKFLQSVKKYLNENDIFMTQEEYFQTYIQLLSRLQDSTYPECSQEIKEGSYSTRLKDAINTYKKHIENNSFSSKVTNAELEELYSLTDCLRRRLDDKLQHELLKVTFPHVLEHPLISKKLNIKGVFLKDVKKKNGFCAMYYVLVDKNGNKIEVQLQSEMRYIETKNGLSNHNDMPSKQIDITPFFELVNPNDDPELLENYLSLLGRTSKSQEKELKQKLEKLHRKFLYSDDNKEKKEIDIAIRKLKKKIDAIETAKNSIKIKDEFIEEFDMIDIEGTKQEDNYEIKEINGKQIKVYDTKTKKRTSKMTIEQYLPIFAEYVSPTSMSVISSAHTTFASEAYINNKNLIEGFTEILRKNDEVPYLSELLIDKLKEILNVKDTHQISYDELERYAEEDYYAKDIDRLDK